MRYPKCITIFYVIIAILLIYSSVFLHASDRKHSICTNIGYFMFTGDVEDVDSGAINYNISYRMKGIPFICKDNVFTEFAAGFFRVKRDKEGSQTSDCKIDFYPLLLNLHYFIPIESSADIYTKVGTGSVYGRSTITSGINRISNIETSWDPLIKVGFGIDLSKGYTLGYQIEILYNHYFMQGSDLNGITFNGGISYNW